MVCLKSSDVSNIGQRVVITFWNIGMASYGLQCPKMCFARTCATPGVQGLLRGGVGKGLSF